MRIRFCLILFSFSVVLCGAVCSGQCADSFTEQTYNCVYSDQCESQITVQYPNGSQYGVYVQCEGVSCCGQLFTTCYGQGNCEDAKLRGPGVRQRPQTLATQSDLLVADCRGRYALYNPAPAHAKEKSRASMALLDDHIIR